MFLNCATAASYGLYMRGAIKRVEFRDFDSVFYNNVLALPVLLMLTILGEDWPRFFEE